jgi:hypothetical protein
MPGMKSLMTMSTRFMAKTISWRLLFLCTPQVNKNEFMDLDNICRIFSEQNIFSVIHLIFFFPLFHKSSPFLPTSFQKAVTSHEKPLRPREPHLLQTIKQNMGILFAIKILTHL